MSAIKLISRNFMPLAASSLAWNIENELVIYVAGYN